MKKFKKIISTAVIATLVLSMTVTTGCSTKDASKKENKTEAVTDGSENKTESENKTKLVLTVNDTKLFLDEMMYYIMMQEYQLAQTEQMYMSYTGSSYMDSEYSEGVTIREMAKNSTMEAVTTYEVLYQEAVKEGYKMTEEEEKQCDDSVEQMMQSITEEQFKLTGLTKEIIREVMEKMTIALKYMKDTIDAFDIDDKAITAGISKEENRQYNTEFLFVSTAKADAEGKAVEPTEKEKEAAKAKLEAVAEKSKTEEFAKIVETDKEVITETSNFLKGKSMQGEKFEKAAMDLQNKQISDIIETEDGYFIIKMLDNNSTQAYDTACKEAVSKEEQTRFTAKYEELKKTYKIEVNEEVWGPIIMGSNTIIQVTPEENEADGVKTE